MWYLKHRRRQMLELSPQLRAFGLSLAREARLHMHATIILSPLKQAEAC